MRTFLLFVAIALIVAAAGCVGQGPAATADVSIRSGFDPPSIRPNETTLFFVDIENVGSSDIYNMTIDVFDTGLLAVLDPRPGSCIANVAEFRPAQVQSVECTMAVTNPQALVQLTTPTTVKFKVTFQKNISGTYVADALTLDEYRRLERIGALEHKPQSVTFGDGQIEATLRFSKSPPFLAGETVLASLEIRNVGPGNIYTLESSQFVVEQPGAEFVCNFQGTRYSSNGYFVPIACTFAVPADIVTKATYPLSFRIGYEYELRGSSQLTIERG